MQYLTPSQRRCLEAYARSKATYRSIAKRRGTSESTVEKHIHEGYQRLGISRRHQLRGALDAYHRKLSGSGRIAYDMLEIGTGDMVMLKDWTCGTVVNLNYDDLTATVYPQGEESGATILPIKSLTVIEANAGPAETIVYFPYGATAFQTDADTIATFSPSQWTNTFTHVTFLSTENNAPGPSQGASNNYGCGGSLSCVVLFKTAAGNIVALQVTRFFNGWYPPGNACAAGTPCGDYFTAAYSVAKNGTFDY